MHLRDSFVLVPLFAIAACSPSPGTTTADLGSTGTTDDPGSTGDEPTTGPTDPTTTAATNTPPTAPGVAIAPASPTRLDDLTCSVTAESTDADGEAVSYTFAWTRDGVDAGLATETVPAAELDVGQAWECTVTPSDGVDEGPSAAAKVTIGAVCTSLEFDGVDDHVLGAAHITASAWTLEAWVLPGSKPGQQAILSQIDNADEHHNFELGLENLVPYAIAPDGAAWQSAQWGAPVTAGVWHHVAAMYDGTNMWLAVDGVLGDQLVPSAFVETDVPLMIGTRLSADLYFDGTISEARISSKARYTEAFDPPAGLALDADTLGLWRLDEGQGTSAADSSSGGNDGAITGDAVWTMTCPSSGAPLIPETCAEIKANQPEATDGMHTLYVGKDPSKPWMAHCQDMDTDPVEYLPLVNVEEGRNFSQYTASNNSPGTDVRTHFTHLRIDPITLLVDIDDLTFSSSVGQLMHGALTVASMPYAVASGCAGPADGVANVDLVGTPFKLKESFCTAGFEPAGGTVLSMNDQVADLTGGGNCGWSSPSIGDQCTNNPQTANSGFALDLEYMQVDLFQSACQATCDNDLMCNLWPDLDTCMADCLGIETGEPECDAALLARLDCMATMNCEELNKFYFEDDYGKCIGEIMAEDMVCY